MKKKQKMTIQRLMGMMEQDFKIADRQQYCCAMNGGYSYYEQGIMDSINKARKRAGMPPLKRDALDRQVESDSRSKQ